MEIDVIGTVVGPATLTHVTAVHGEAEMGTLVAGDLLRLHFDGGEIELVARRAAFLFTSRFDAPALPDPIPPELVPFLQQGATGFRTRIVRAGDVFRVRGEVERQGARFVARGPIRLEERWRFD